MFNPPPFSPDVASTRTLLIFFLLIAQMGEEIRGQEVQSPAKPSAGESVFKTPFQVFIWKCLAS